jgi:Helicase conserved C-terminal domain
LTQYIDRRFQELEVQEPGKGFVMTIYRRRAASSPFALRKSLDRRATGLKAVIAQRAYDDTVLELDDAEELEDLLNVKLTSALPETPEEARAELTEVEKLLLRIDSLGRLDTKRDRLVSWVKNLTADGRSILVFTGYADTMEYLRDSLVGALGNAVASYSGDGGAFRCGTEWKPASKDAVTKSLRDGRTKVLVCTDAASEGLNLQAAGALVNFDLPWNPSKVEQRIGRVDRIGQEQPVLPIVNLYLQDSVDERVYRALATRCGLFETFVGPMQPVLSQAMRMLIGREHVNEEILAKTAEAIKADPALMQAYPEDDALPLPAEKGFVGPEHSAILLGALEGTEISVHAESNLVHRIGDGPLRIVTHPSGIETQVYASCVDGLDKRQWELLRHLQQPGERLPLIVVGAEEDGFRVMACGWMTPEGTRPVQSFTELHSLVTEWEGLEIPKVADGLRRAPCWGSALGGFGRDSAK